MIPRPRPAVRGILLTEDSRVLLVRLVLATPTRIIWIAPGGGVDAHESAHSALEREIWEETGFRLEQGCIGPELWQRQHDFMFNGDLVSQHERFFLIRIDYFEPRVVHLDEGFESDSFGGFKWWPIDEIPDSSLEFAPTNLGCLLRSLRADGVPHRPFAVDP